MGIRDGKLREPQLDEELGSGHAGLDHVWILVDAATD